MTLNALKQIEQQGEIEAWKQVPDLVSVRYKEAASVQQNIKKIIRRLPPSDYGYCYWHPTDKKVWVVLGDSDDEHVHQKWHNSLKAIPGVRGVQSESEVSPPDRDDWIRIKAAAGLNWLNAPYQAAGLPSGGPSPMSNALVSGLLGAGLGYGGGALAEHLFPERFVERGRLRKTLALMGGLGGAAMSLPKGFANMSINQDSTGSPHAARSFFAGDQHQNLSPKAQNHYEFLRGQVKQNAWQSMRGVCEQLPEASPIYIKCARLGAGSRGVRPVPVDAFNNAIWNDVHNGLRSSQSNAYGTRSPYGDNSQQLHTPPMHAAAAAGLVSGVRQMYGNRPLLSPRHFINGLANAGVDLVTARLAGGALGALGGLTPAAQSKLQDIGVWGGMIRGITGSIFGLR